MKTQANPKWWSATHETAWERAERVLRGKPRSAAPETSNNGAGKTGGPDDMTGKGATEEEQPHPSGSDDIDAAQRFGVGARVQYGAETDAWNPSIENQLREDWEAAHPDPEDSWAKYRDAVRCGWDYKLIDGS